MTTEMNSHDAKSRTLDEHHELAVLIAYSEDDYLRRQGTLNGSAQAVATAIQQAGYSKQSQLSEEELELLRMALQNAVSRSQDVARDLRSKPGVSAAASGSLTRRYRLLLERFGGPSLPVSPVRSASAATDSEDFLESEYSRKERALILPSELPNHDALVSHPPSTDAIAKSWYAAPMDLELEDGEAYDHSHLFGGRGERDDPTKEYGIANFGDLKDIIHRSDGERTSREWATNRLQKEYGDILVARDWNPEPPLAS